MTSEPPVGLRVDLQDPDGRWVSVGVLRRSNETATFSSFEEYWALSERPVLGQMFEQRGPMWQPSATTALPTWFANLLPEGPLRHAIASDIGVNEEREFFLLARVGGNDLPGAVRIAVVEAGEDPLEVEPDDEDADPATEPSDALKFSLAGVQLKFSVADEARGLTVPARGESGTWIAKLPDRRPGFEACPRQSLLR
jgi:serine/threonine-protein kinase HipA